MDSLGLKELLDTVKSCIEAGVSGLYWVRAEVNEVKVHYSGHCYLSLVENHASSGLQAKVQAVIWATTFRMLDPYFRSATGSGIAPGMNLLVKVSVKYSPLYGLSLNIVDIDPSYTVGELEMARRNTIARLEREGVADMNRSLPFPYLPRTFAVISSASAAGYRDFMEHLVRNPYGYTYRIDLYEALVQGDKAPASMISAMDAVLSSGVPYDAVLILRGGGAVADMVCFDDYGLALNIANYPLPVLTAVGHDKDFHVCDAVAYMYLKTPTALADYILDITKSLENRADTLADTVFGMAKVLCAQESLKVERLAGAVKLQIQRLVRLKVEPEYRRIDAFGQTVRHLAGNRILAERNMLDSVSGAVLTMARSYLMLERSKLDMLESRIGYLNPSTVLERGYAVASIPGDGMPQRIGSVSQVSEGMDMSVRLKDGVIGCRVVSIDRDSENVED